MFTALKQKRRRGGEMENQYNKKIQMKEPLKFITHPKVLQ
jgi:hypothetical protein